MQFKGNEDLVKEFGDRLISKIKESKIPAKSLFSEIDVWLNDNNIIKEDDAFHCEDGGTLLTLRDEIKEYVYIHLLNDSEYRLQESFDGGSWFIDLTNHHPRNRLIKRMGYRIFRLGFRRWDKAQLWLASHYETQYVKRLGIPKTWYLEYRRRVYDYVCNHYGLSFSDPDDYAEPPFAYVEKFDNSKSMV